MASTTSRLRGSGRRHAWAAVRETDWSATSGRVFKKTEASTAVTRAVLHREDFNFFDAELGLPLVLHARELARVGGLVDLVNVPAKALRGFFEGVERLRGHVRLRLAGACPAKFRTLPVSGKPRKVASEGARQD